MTWWQIMILTVFFLGLFAPMFIAVWRMALEK